MNAARLIAVGTHECVTCPRCACTFAAVHPACPRCSEESRERAAWEALAWYDDHKRTDGFYDGNLWGDLSERAAAASSPGEEETG